MGQTKANSKTADLNSAFSIMILNVNELINNKSKIDKMDFSKSKNVEMSLLNMKTNIGCKYIDRKRQVIQQNAQNSWNNYIHIN